MHLQIWPHTYDLPEMTNSVSWTAAKKSLAGDFNAALYSDQQLFSLAMYIYCQAHPHGNTDQNFM
jgi:hypothetical protein